MSEPSPQSLYISAGEHAEAWKKQKIKTASEPSALGFPHYIVGAYHPAIAEVDAALRSAPYQLGFSPEDWHTITDLQILKKEQVYDVEKMRTIQLMNAAFNINNKKLGRDMMVQAEKRKLMAKEQYGSRKRHKSVVACANKVWTMDKFDRHGQQQRWYPTMPSNATTE